jgi:hypothetical protein
MHFRLNINTDNAAFEGEKLVPELTAISDKALTRIYNDETSGTLRDSNGNTVGSYQLVDEPQVYTLAEIKNGTGFKPGVRFQVIEEG